MTHDVQRRSLLSTVRPEAKVLMTSCRDLHECLVKWCPLNELQLDIAVGNEVVHVSLGIVCLAPALLLLGKLTLGAGKVADSSEAGCQLSGFAPLKLLADFFEEARRSAVEYGLVDAAGPLLAHSMSETGRMVEAIANAKGKLYDDIFAKLSGLCESSELSSLLQHINDKAFPANKPQFEAILASDAAKEIWKAWKTVIVAETQEKEWRSTVKQALEQMQRIQASRGQGTLTILLLCTS
jgi:hypothetical protein